MDDENSAFIVSVLVCFFWPTKLVYMSKDDHVARELSRLTDSERPWVRVPVGPRFFPPL